ncbi:hypothetical protein PF005_g17085 [Phytophthora fragariae]|uniref:Uncharacterized protein n=2 Tax=Phytophthora TaxID=4783 RepID=A0A6A3RKK5_9STRA|nr:hypothetical protein PF003_g40519 [Phytophthora fragariae]KAE9018047.1 hypothetical protein PR002_g13212 [Phytophthora rubi]KAE8931655.1 hypothetical protein PF009_g18291 [Phytophthora fragariae]KAE8994955.1 hypothetical protein PF011_g16534 [Phytophthora fragariae]KAE9095707.1 hypothetical protein PF007_g17279 [Phytophthora fragariae]
MFHLAPVAATITAAQPQQSLSASSTGTMYCRPRSSPIEIPASQPHSGSSSSS